MLKYVRSRESIASARAARYPLQLVTPHPKYSFHTQADGKDSVVNDLEEHRLRIDGRWFWVLRLNPADAAARGIADRSLARVYNELGEVLCAACLTHRVRPGVVHAYESAARYDPVGEPGASLDIGGAINLLTPKQPQFARGHAMGNSNCLVEVAPWKGPVPGPSQPGLPDPAPAAQAARAGGVEP